MTVVQSCKIQFHPLFGSVPWRIHAEAEKINYLMLMPAVLWLTEAFKGLHCDLWVSTHFLLHFLPCQEIKHSLRHHFHQSSLHGSNLWCRNSTEFYRLIQITICLVRLFSLDLNILCDVVLPVPCSLLVWISVPGVWTPCGLHIGPPLHCLLESAPPAARHSGVWCTQAPGQT